MTGNDGFLLLHAECKGVHPCQSSAAVTAASPPMLTSNCTISNEGLLLMHTQRKGVNPNSYVDLKISSPLAFIMDCTVRTSPSIQARRKLRIVSLSSGRLMVTFYNRCTGWIVCCRCLFTFLVLRLYYLRDNCSEPTFWQRELYRKGHK